SRKPVSEVSAGELPCLLVGPGRNAAVLLSMSGDKNGWGLIYIPQTASVLPDRRRPAKPGTPGAARDTAMMMRTMAIGRLDEAAIYAMFGEDRSVIVPQLLDHGGHLLALPALEASWKAIVLGKWRPLDNWDLTPPVDESQKPPP